MSASRPQPRLAQLALCTRDIASTVRLYTEAFGFAESGSHVFWGSYLGRIQKLGDDATCLTWWMVGRQDLLQLEIFQHVDPVQQPLPADWRPSDIGWTRWGVAVPDFDFAVGRLAKLGAPVFTEPQTHDGLRRVCVRDPGSGVFIELFEEGAATPGGIRTRDNSLAPAVVYSTISVSDLDGVRDFYLEVLGLEEAQGVVLHTPEMEALWGLEGASVESCVLRAGDSFLELVQYADPVGRPPDPGRRLSDQGFMNGGFHVRERQHFDEILARAAERGIVPNIPPPDRRNSEAYLNDGHGNLLELMLVPREFEAEYGFRAAARFPPAYPWPDPRSGPASR